MLRLLVTRPIEEAERTAASLRALGHEVLIAPVLQIEAVDNANLGRGPWSAVLMTSGNAARALSAHPRLGEIVRLPLFAVGGQTAQAARDAGFTDVTSADGDSSDLIRLVALKPGDPNARLLYLAGSDRARDLAGDLAADGLPVETIVIYRAVAATTLADHVAEALRKGAVDGVLHFSRRSTAILVDCAAAGGLTEQIRSPTHYCLSARAAEPLADMGAVRIRIAARPDEAALLALISAT